MYLLEKELEDFFIHDKYVFLIQASNRFAKILYKLALKQGRTFAESTFWKN